MKFNELINHIGSIQQFSAQAAQFFELSLEKNIFECEGTDFKIVKLVHQGIPVYFLIYERLGAGAYGEVSEGVALSISDGIILEDQKVAIKITDFTQKGSISSKDIDDERKRAVAEHQLLEKIGQTYGFSIGKRRKTVTVLDDGTGILKEIVRENVELQEAVLAMPLFPGKDIANHAHQHKFSYGSMTLTSLACQLSVSLLQLHERNVIHADLKPANVLWDASERYANIVDFNQAKILKDGEEYALDAYSSDKDYMAPESKAVGVGMYKYSKASDIYSLGKILFENFELKQGVNLENNKYLSYDQLIVKPFIKRMMSVNERQRPIASDCCEFFSGLDKKMQLDITQKDNETRLQISKLIIELEVYANKLRKEMIAEHKKTLIVDDKNKKYEKTLDIINLLVRISSDEEIDLTKLLNGCNLLFQQDPSVQVISDYQGCFDQMATHLGKNLSKKNDLIRESPKPNALLLFAIQHPILTAGLVGLFIAALVVASIFSFGIVAGVAVAIGATVGLSGTSALIASTAAGAVAAGLITGGATFFAIKRDDKQEDQGPTIAPKNES